MFAYIRGILNQTAPTYVVIEANGIGYKVSVPVSALSSLPSIGSQILLHTSFIVRELSHSLYGFFQHQERDFFEALISVTGIGPKIALALIGHMPLSELQRAISSEETATLCKIPGIGKKSAERLIVEMRDKVGTPSFHPSELSAHFLADPSLQMSQDAISALVNLGYHQAIAQKAIKKGLNDLSGDIDLSSLISFALKNI